jgi:hypothetical protein
MNLTTPSPGAQSSTGASPWVYLFSQFTSEALLFESLFILALISAYAAFWVVKRRRYGTAGPTLPSAPIKTYLNELIAHAEHLRLQLFGLLSASGPPLPMPPTQTKAAEPNPLLEARLADLTRALEVSTAERARLEKQVAEIKAAASAADGQAKITQNDEAIKMEQKIQALEDKLAEYSIIEDDLANLKRFQQENTKLKAFLTEKGIEAPDFSGGPPPVPEASSAPATTDEVTPEVAHAPLPPDEVPMTDESSEEEGTFSGIADKIESSLNLPDTTKSEETKSTSSEPPQAESPSTSTSSSEGGSGGNPLNKLGALAQAHDNPDADPATLQKNEDDLVKEFEKMLRD